ncbi:GGDEF domain-containing protein [Amycolatopsis sp. PS_44_ISF1]|uniref:GGDEF domain-containing protein n=1 Tax=Amycolatopsis sp. PS_44_ISF1 TaxID=2974917 RepID=UPI0028E09DA2|nr:GGDEF domain-containing protein [Amycolatopsis sp. PS_44_ISF1]MDT8909482.1 GGDEF domain-containing protein [Amycolatopsis sp. PS_44_ISF1]
MDVPATGSRSGAADGPEARARFERDRTLRALRARWRTASLAAGWRFPSDWALPEVDAVCAAVVRHGASGAETALAGLGRARAAAGAGLAETLSDLAALHAVLAEPEAVDGFVSPEVDATPARILRVTALAWADVATDQLVHTEVTDPLTGLPSAAYLRTRLAELYRGGGWEDKVLLVVAMDLASVSGWPRLTGMILAADAVRSVFDAGESYATLGPSTVAVLADRDDRLASHGVALRRALNDRLSVDAQLSEVSRPRVSALRLPPTHERACVLLAELARG